MSKKWYIVQAHSGFENKVKTALTERISSSGYKSKFGEILVPTEEVVELVKGKKKTSSRKFYPGYMLISMEMNNETWHIVNGTAKVSGFLGEQGKPLPIPDSQVEYIIGKMESGKMSPQPKFSFQLGDHIKVIDGPFNNFNGTVEEVRPEKGKLKVMVTIFGRSTPVELDFIQVTRLT